MTDRKIWQITNARKDECSVVSNKSLPGNKGNGRLFLKYIGKDFSAKEEIGNIET